MSPFSSEHVLDWISKNEAKLAKKQVTLSYAKGQASHGEAAILEAWGPGGRMGELVLSISGECDAQVVREDDDTLIMNENRLLGSEIEMNRLFTLFCECVAYKDKRSGHNQDSAIAKRILAKIPASCR